MEGWNYASQITNQHRVASCLESVEVEKIVSAKTIIQRVDRWDRKIMPAKRASRVTGPTIVTIIMKFLVALKN